MLKVGGIEIAQRHVEYALKVDDEFGAVIFCSGEGEAVELAKEVRGGIVVVHYVLVSFWQNLLTGEIVYDEIEGHRL